MSKSIRILIVDDQPIIRRGLTMLLANEADLSVIGVASDGAEALTLVRQFMPDVVLMDLQMQPMSGVVATREIAQDFPNTRVVVLTTFDHDDLVFDAIRAGAQAYLLKDASETDIAETVRAVHRGECRLSPSIAKKVMEQFRKESSNHPQKTPAQSNDPALSSLNDKERRVLEMLALGLSNKQIAAQIFLAEGTVKNYVSRIMEKLHAQSRMELALRVSQAR
jgi:DNA-binding NarL/FixJ family response regulator